MSSAQPESLPRVGYWADGTSLKPPGLLFWGRVVIPSLMNETQDPRRNK